METGKPQSVSTPLHSNSVAAETQKKMDIQAPLTTVYIQTVPALPPQLYPQAQLPVSPQEPSTFHLAVPPLYSKEMLPFLTLHIAGGLPFQQLESSSATAVPMAKPKSTGKHVCPHCRRDCMKPSVLEKHLRCHTGERPYPCTTCRVSFKTQSNLYKHKRTQAHARLSSESEQSSMGSQDSLCSSRETGDTGSSLDGSGKESGSMEKDARVLSTEIMSPISSTQVHSVDTGGPTRDPIKEQNDSLSPTVQGSLDINRGEESKKLPVTPNRHVPLQRQEATLFSKEWESSVSRAKPQSLESTDSGFSESSDQHSSPDSALPDKNIDSLIESSMGQREQPRGSHTTVGPGQSGLEPKDSVSGREQKALEERILKLISENSVVVEDKQLENVRPRKTMLSKKGSIDLPMPYTYKDSFHFDMRISNSTSGNVPGSRKPAFYSAVPTQCSDSMGHAPLTRSSSLPYSVALLQPERSSSNASLPRDNVTLTRSGSAGPIHPTAFAAKSVDQQVSAHRPLVRQVAVDCNHTTEGALEEPWNNNLSCDGESGDICGEPSGRKRRKKKAQKFAYNKWYMYRGGTFKKLYNVEKSSDDSAYAAKESLSSRENSLVASTRSLSGGHTDTTASIADSTTSIVTVCHPSILLANLPTVSAVELNPNSSQVHQSCISQKTLLRNNRSESEVQLSFPRSSDIYNTEITGRAEKPACKEKHAVSISQPPRAHIHSDRKKQKTGDNIIHPPLMETDPNTLTPPSMSVCGNLPTQNTNLTYINSQPDDKGIQLKGTLLPSCIINVNKSVFTSTAISVLSAAKTAFLPKYQLKLPNTTEPECNPSQHIGKTSKGNEVTITSIPIFQNATSVTTSKAPEKRCAEPPHWLVVNTQSVEETNSAQAQPVSHLKSAAPCLSETSVPLGLTYEATTTVTIAQRHFTTITTTTASMHDHHSKLSSSLIQTSPSNSVKASVPERLPRPVTPILQKQSGTPSITMEQNHPSAPILTVFSQDSAPSHAHSTHSSPALGLFNSINAARSNSPLVSCHALPFDSAQLDTARNVFHVQTADLQICLQIISDEQLALIEPRMEMQEITANTNFTQRSNLEAIEDIQVEAKSTVPLKSMDEGMLHENTADHREIYFSEPSSSRNAESIEQVHFQRTQPSTDIAEQVDKSQAQATGEFILSQSSNLPLQPQDNVDLNISAETMKVSGHMELADALLKAVKSEMRQAPEEKNTCSLNFIAQQQESGVRQCGLGGEKLSSQHNLCPEGIPSLFPSPAAQNTTGNRSLHQESKHKPLDHEVTCYVDEAKAKCKGHERTSSQDGEAHLALPAEASRASGTESGHAAPIGVIPQSNCDLTHSGSLTIETLQPFGHLNATSSDTAHGELHGRDGLFTSEPHGIQVQRPSDVIGPTVNESTITGPSEGGLLAGCTAQKEPETQGLGRSPPRPDSAGWDSTQSQAGWETDKQCRKGEEKNTHSLKMKESNPWENSRLSERQHLNLSQTHSGMSEHRHRRPPWVEPSRLADHPITPAGVMGWSSLLQPESRAHSLQPENGDGRNQQTCSTEHDLQHHHVGQAREEFSQLESDPLRSQTNHQSRGEAVLPPSAQASHRGDTASHTAVPGSSDTSLRCSHYHRTLGVLSVIQPHCVHASGAQGEVTGDTQANNEAEPDVAASVTRPWTFTHAETSGYQAAGDQAPGEPVIHGGDPHQAVIHNKCQALLSAGHLHSYQPPDCLSSTMRPVLESCQDYPEDTSSSDDEGKLIIEL